MSINLSPRTSANLNGALIVLGLLGTVDNVLVHWILGLHRLIEGSEYTLHVEILMVIASTGLLAVGFYRERSARQRQSNRPGTPVNTDPERSLPAEHGHRM